MAEPEEREEKEEKEEREEKKPKEEKTVEKSAQDRAVERDQEPSLVDCPECDLSVREDKLGSHRWKAHQVERRVDREKKDVPDDDGIAPKRKHATTTTRTKEEKKTESTGLFGAWKK